MNHARQFLVSRITLSVVVAWILLASASVRAQEEPVVIGQPERTERPFLHMDRITGGLQLLGRSSSNTLKSGGSTVESQTTDFSESINLSTGGYILGPAFLSFAATGSLGLNQAKLVTDGQTTQSNSTVDMWDVTANMLSASPAPLSLYTNRSSILIDQQFGPSLENINTNSGVIVELNWINIENRLELSHSETEQRGLADADAGQSDFSTAQDTFSWTGHAKPSPNQDLNWNYVYTSAQQSGNTVSSFETHTANLAHNVSFGQDNMGSLVSAVALSRNSGVSNSEAMHWTEVLNLRHSDTFNTHYQYSFDRTSYGDTEIDNHRASAGFMHRLYKSLITTGEAGVLQSQAGDAQNREYFADLDLDYVKKVPFGQLSALMTFGYVHAESEARTETIRVFDRPNTLVDAFPIIFPRTQIDPDSLVVTDATGLFTYAPGLDYTVDSFPDRVEIRRVIGGRIAPGDRVLFDYMQPAAPDSAVDTLNLSIAGRYGITEGLLKHLGVYGRYSRVNQSINSSRAAEIIPTDSQDYLVGVDYRFSNVMVGAERRWHDSQLAPYEITRLFARYGYRMSAMTSLSANVTWQTTEYQSTPVHATEQLSASFSLDHRFSQRLSAAVSATYFEQNDDLSGHTQGFEQALSLRWRYRQTSVFAAFRNSSLSTESQDRTFQSLTIGLTRDF